MRDNLPNSPPRHIESAILNLDGIRGKGTHWVAYKKRGGVVEYYDSYGDLPPPEELVKYLRRGSKAIKIVYNYDRQQDYNTVWCGHLCFKFLSSKSGNYVL